MPEDSTHSETRGPSADDDDVSLGGQNGACSDSGMRFDNIQYGNVASVL